MWGGVTIHLYYGRIPVLYTRSFQSLSNFTQLSKREKKQDQIVDHLSLKGDGLGPKSHRKAQGD
jgi:hypothetical protein